MEKNTTRWGNSLGPRRARQGRLRKPGEKKIPEIAEGEGTPFKINISNNIQNNS